MIKFIKQNSSKVLFILLLILLALLILITIYQEFLINNNYVEKDFLTSFRASLFEDLIFFSLVGIVLYIITFRNLEDEKIDTRIESLINSNFVTSLSKENFKEEFKSLLTYYEDLFITIFITDYNDKKKIVRVETKFKGNIVNMSKEITAETKIKAYAFSDDEVNSIAGEVKFLEILDSKGKEIFDEIESYKIDKDKGYTNSTPIKLNENVTFKYSFWVWNKICISNSINNDEGFKISADRFVNTLHLDICNKTNKNFDIIVFKGIPNDLSINWKEEKKFTTNNIKHKIHKIRKKELISLNFKLINKGVKNDKK